MTFHHILIVCVVIMSMEGLHVYPEVAFSIADGTPSQSGSQYVKLHTIITAPRFFSLTI